MPRGLPITTYYPPLFPKEWEQLYQIFLKFRDNKRYLVINKAAGVKVFIKTIEKNANDYWGCGLCGGKFDWFWVSGTIHQKDLPHWYTFGATMTLAECHACNGTVPSEFFMLFNADIDCPGATICRYYIDLKDLARQ